MQTLQAPAWSASDGGLRARAGLAPAAERALRAKTHAPLTARAPGAGRPEPEHLRGARVQHAGPLLAGRVCGQRVDRPGARPACTASRAPAPGWGWAHGGDGCAGPGARPPCARLKEPEQLGRARATGDRPARRTAYQCLQARGSSLAHALSAAEDELSLGVGARTQRLTAFVVHMVEALCRLCGSASQLTVWCKRRRAQAGPEARAVMTQTRACSCSRLRASAAARSAPTVRRARLGGSCGGA